MIPKYQVITLFHHATCFHFCPFTSFFHFTIFNACTTSNPEPNPISIYPDLNPNPYPNPDPNPNPEPNPNPNPDPNPNPNPNPDPNLDPNPNPNIRTIDWNPFPLLTLKSSSTTSHTLKPHLQLNQNQTQSTLHHTPWDVAIATLTASFNPLRLLYAECSLFGCFRTFFLTFLRTILIIYHHLYHTHRYYNVFIQSDNNSYTHHRYYGFFKGQKNKLVFSRHQILCETTIHICEHVVPRPASRLETCFPSYAWNLMTHN